jgi:hypothetical protein
MSFIYPTNPVVGQDYIINGKSLRYNGIGFIPSPQTSDQAPDVLTEILPTDYIGGRRSVTGAEWTFETLRDNIFASGGAYKVFVSTAAEFTAAIGLEYNIVEICVTKPITVNPFLNVYADYVYITGCEITLPDHLISCNKTSTNNTTNYLIDNALLHNVTDPIASVIVVTSSQSITRTWNITVRDFKTTRPLGILVTTGCQLNLITGNPLILDAQQLVGSYTVAVDATLDLGQEDIRLDGSNVLDVSPAILPGDKMLIKKGNYNFEMVDVAALSTAILTSDRVTIVAVVERLVDAADMVEVASMPSGWELDYIDIKRIDGTEQAVGIAIIAEYEGTTVLAINQYTEQQALIQGHTQRHSYYLDSTKSAGTYEVAGLYKLWINNYGVSKKLYAVRGSGAWPEGVILEFRTVIKKTL